MSKVNHSVQEMRSKPRSSSFDVPMGTANSRSHCGGSYAHPLTLCYPNVQHPTVHHPTTFHPATSGSPNALTAMECPFRLFAALLGPTSSLEPLSVDGQVSLEPHVLTCSPALAVQEQEASITPTPEEGQ